jgi:hypothetical protein
MRRKMVIKEQQLRSLIKRELQKKQLLKELRDMPVPGLANFTKDDYIITMTLDDNGKSTGFVYTIPTEHAESPSSHLKFVPYGVYKDYLLSPATRNSLETFVAAGVASKGEQEISSYSQDFAFKNDMKRAEPGSLAEKWKSPDDVPDTYIYYQLLRPNSLAGLRVNHTKKEIDTHMKHLGWMSRRGGDVPGQPKKNSQSFVIPSADTTRVSQQDMVKLLKHIQSRDTRDILKYPIVGLEDYYGKTVQDVLDASGDSGVTSLQRILDPSDSTVVAYHGTTDKLAKQILEKGLRPGRSQFTYVDQIPNWSENNIYLTLHPTYAENYATRAAIWYGGKPTVLKVIVPDPARIVADEDSWREFKVEPPLMIDGEAVESLNPKRWMKSTRDYWLKQGWIDEERAQEIDAMVNAQILKSLKTGLKSENASFAYRGTIMPKHIAMWRQYDKKSFGKEGSFSDEQYEKIRQGVKSAMKRFDV